MEVKIFKLSNLSWKNNKIRRHNETQIKELQSSISRFGITRPVVVDEDMNVLAGAGLCIACQGMGIEEVPVKILKGISEAGKKSFMLADNQIHDLGTSNNAEVEALLAEIANSGEEDISIPGYDDELLKALAMTEDEVDDISVLYGDVANGDNWDGKDDPVDNTDYEEQYTRGAQKHEDKTRSETPAEKPLEVQNPNVNVAGDKPFIKCQQCGGKVWL